MNTQYGTSNISSVGDVGQAAISCRGFPDSVSKQKRYGLIFDFSLAHKYSVLYKNVDFAALFSPTRMSHILN